MFCSKCGTQLPDGSAFCTNCGSPVNQQAVQPAMQQPAQPVAQMQPVQPAVQPAQQQYGAPVPPTQQQGYAPTGAVPSNPPVRGCFGSGWDDVRGSEGWFKKVALLALINMVPIFNWVSVGYGWRWGKDVAMGRREGLPQKIVDGDNFKLGAYMFVIGLVASLVLGIEGAILGIIPILGILVAIALGIFATMFLNLAFMRTALYDRLGAGFEVGTLFDGYKRNLGTLFCISFVPSLVAAGIGMIVGFLFMAIIGAIAGADILAVLASASRYGSYRNVPDVLVYSMGGSIVVVILLGLVATYLELMIAQFCQLITQRAMGHYIARFVPEWAAEAAMGPQATGSAPYGQQPGAGAPVPPNPAAPAIPQQAAVAAEPALPASGATAPAAAPVMAQPAAAAAPAAATATGVAAAGVAAATAMTAAAKSDAPQEPAYAASDSYAFDETSVLPEYPEDMDTIVQPEETGALPDRSMFQPVPEQSEPAAPAEKADDAVRLQPTVASGPLVGDDSDTMVLMEEAAAAAVTEAQPAVAQHTLQLTRANGDTCVLTSFPVTIGKGSEADLVIDGNGAISRVHARILRDGDVFAAEDLGSTNKTFIGSYELPPNTPTILSDGDVLKLANEALQVKVV